MPKNGEKVMVLQDYFQIKKQIPSLPIKISFYLSALERISDSPEYAVISKGFTPQYRRLFGFFIKQEVRERRTFLLGTAKLLRTGLNRTKQNQCVIQQIDTTCYIRQNIWVFSGWQRRHFKMNIELSQIKIQGDKHTDIIDLREYYGRRSTKENQALVFESLSENVCDRLKKISLKFKSERLFLEIYEKMKKCLIECHYHNIIKDLGNRENQQKDFSSIRGLKLWNRRLKENYQKIREDLLSKIQRNQLKFTEIYQSKGLRLLKNYKIKGMFKLELEMGIQINRLLIEMSLIKGGTMGPLQVQKVERVSSNSQIIFLRFHGQEKQLIQTMGLVEIIPRKYEHLVVFYGIDCFNLGLNIPLMMVSLNQSLTPGRTIVNVLGRIRLIKKGQPYYLNILNLLLSAVNYSEELNSTFQTILSRGDQDEFLSIYGQEEQQDNLDQDQRSSDLQNLATEEIDNEVALEVEETFFENKIEYFPQMRLEEFKQNQYASNKLSFKRREQNRKIEKTKSNIKQMQPISGYLRHKYGMKGDQFGPRLFLKDYFLSDWKRVKQGGVICVKDESLQEQKKILKRIFTNMGSNLIRGKNITTVSLPVQIFKPESTLVCIAKNLTYAPLLLENLLSEEPLFRMKRTLIFALTMSVTGISMQKPFNPILGQTFQGQIDSCPVYVEQISHHPPISSYLFKGRGYTVFGNVQPKINLSINSATGYSELYHTLHFDNEEKITFNLGKMVIGGLIFGERTFNFQSINYLIDEKNCLVTQVLYGQKKSSFFSRCSDAKDSVTGSIYKVNSKIIEKFKKDKMFPQKKQKQQGFLILSSFNGIWNEYLKIDGQTVLQFQKDFPLILAHSQYSLESDALKRTDIKYLQQKDVQKAQQQKCCLQQVQRREQKLRKKMQKSKK